MMLVKAKMIAVGFMVAGGVAAPIVTHHATTPTERAIPAKAELAPEAPTVVVPPAPEVVMGALTIEEEAAPAAARSFVLPTMPSAPTPVTPPPVERDKERKCERRALHSLSDGGVIICDVQRSDNHKDGGGVFATVKKPNTLVARDLPSPSGLLR